MKRIVVGASDLTDGTKSTSLSIFSDFGSYAYNFIFGISGVYE